MKTKIDNLNVMIAGADYNGRICYILGFEPESQHWLDEVARRYNICVATITGMDWDNDLTPWTAPGVPAGPPTFKGNGNIFLSTLRTAVLPAIEKEVGTVSPQRTLLGISLSGLFALWQWIGCDTFTNIVSLSGSFWYRGFTEWFSANIGSKIDSRGKIFLSLGRQEPMSRNPIFRTVGVCTAQILAVLRAHGVYTEFIWEPGDHYASYEPRTLHALDFIYA